jgi:hypothetical protein
MSSIRSIVTTLAVASVTVAASMGCGKGPAFGSDNAIIVVVPEALESSLTDPIRRSFERTVLTTRDEPVFEVTFTTPGSIGEFTKWKRLVIIETTGDALLLPELVDVPASGEVVEEVHDKWARGQTIHALGADTPAATSALVHRELDSLYELIHQDFVDYHVRRMWASGPDSSLARQMADDLGFSIVLPRVYRPAQASAPPDTRTWFNVDPRRVVSIHWVPGRESAELDPDSVLAVREAWGHALFPGDSIVMRPDTTGTSPRLIAIRSQLAGQSAIRLQGVWENHSDVSAGVFLTYGLVCNERLVLLDGNLYAPDRPKYPFLIQLEQIFETFRCASGAA